MKYRSSYFASLVVSFVSVLVVIGPSAKATYIATLNEVGSNVFGTGSGSIDTADLSLIDSGTGNAEITPFVAGLALGSGSGKIYIGTSGRDSFGPGMTEVFADSSTGSLVAVTGLDGEVGVPGGYASGTPIAPSTATWNNQTFASLGVTPGTYVWTWGTGIHADSFTLQIGPAGPTNGVPEGGGALVLMLGGIGMLIAFRSKLEVRS